MTNYNYYNQEDAIIQSIEFRVSKKMMQSNWNSASLFHVITPLIISMTFDLCGYQSTIQGWQKYIMSVITR